MLIYLDSNIVIYFIEQPGNFGPRAAARIARIRANRDRMIVSDLTRRECLIHPLRAGDLQTLADFDKFFKSSDVQVLGLPTPVFERATLIRARHRFLTPDALNLAVAVEAGCD